MKIGLLTGEYPPMEGGVGAFTKAIAQALYKLGHQVFIISSYKARPADRKFTRRQLSDPIDIGYAHLLPQTRRWKWRDTRLVTELVIRYELDIINIQYQPAAYNMRHPAINLLPWRLRGVTPSVVTFHDLRTPYFFPKAGYLRQAAIRLMATYADGIITTNAADYATLSPDHATVTTIPIGNNITDVMPVTARERLKKRAEVGVEKEDVLLAYFGFLNESKGAETIIDLLSKVPSHYHLLFIGGQTGASDTANNKHYQQMIEEKIIAYGIDDRVHWTGFVDDWEVAHYFSAADLTILPYQDGASLRRGTLMAALAFGQAIMTTTPSSAIPALIHGENCWLVTAGDTDAMATAVVDLIDQPLLRQTLGKNAKALSTMFSWDSIGMQTADFFAEICQETKAN